MSIIDSPSRVFEPGTTGWTARDLDDPVIERQWFRGRYEIVEGVLAKMPAAYYTGGEALQSLIKRIDQHLEKHGPEGRFASEVDIVVDEDRVAVADAVFLTLEQRGRQREASRRAGRKDVRRTRILIPPTLIIESVSPGHERHDDRTKRRWYAEFGVPNYWILDAFQRTLRCLRLAGKQYEMDQEGDEVSEIRTSAF